MGKPRGLWPQLIVALAVLAATTRASNAQRSIGTVTDVRPVESRCTSSNGSGDAAHGINLHQPPTAPQPVKAPYPRDLSVAVRFYLSKRTDARLRIDDSTFGRGVIVLAPQLLCGLWAADRTIRPVKSDSGIYAIDTVALRQQPAFLRLSIERGGAFIQWDSTLKYRLRVNTFDLTGTEVVVAVDSSGRRSLLYVQKGTVTFSAYPALTATTGQLYLLEQEFPPQLVSTTTWIDTAELRDDVDLHSRRVWDQPSIIERLVRNPYSYVVSGIVGYFVYKALTRGSASSGDVVVRIPL